MAEDELGPGSHVRRRNQFIDDECTSPFIRSRSASSPSTVIKSEYSTYLSLIGRELSFNQILALSDNLIVVLTSTQKLALSFNRHYINSVDLPHSKNASITEHNIKPDHHHTP